MDLEPPLLVWRYRTPDTNPDRSCLLELLASKRIRLDVDEEHSFASVVSVDVVGEDELVLVLEADSVSHVHTIVLEGGQDSPRVVASILRLLPTFEPRDLLMYTSRVARWPAENDTFDKVVGSNSQYLLNHFSCATLGLPPAVGRIYISPHSVHVSVSFWSEQHWTFDLYAMSNEPILSGRTLDLGKGCSVSVLLASECIQTLRAARNRIKSTKCFGVALSVLQSRQNCVIPLFVRGAVEYLSLHLEEEGIFRVSGSARVVAEMSLALDEGFAIDFAKNSVADVATLLKRFLGDIPGKLISFFQIVKNDLGSPDLLPELIASNCPPEHQSFLRFILSFIQRVEANCKTNKMTRSNLAMVFSPVMIEMPDLQDFAAASQLMEMLIANPEKLLPL